MSAAATSLRALQRKLERLELEHLRQHALELHERLEKAEAALANAEDAAEFWQRSFQMMQEAAADDLHATHRCVGLTRTGELMVVQQ